MKSSPDKVEKEIKKAAQEISTESYPMSVGEFLSMYKNKELDLHPEFQRFFRWDSYRKSRFIESLLLGIPIPSVFVAQDSNGRWDVVDGLQRLSTILELTGDLIDVRGTNICPPLVLEKTKYIPSLEGQSWATLPEYARLQIKRAKIDIKIVLNKSTPDAKFELFQRLNTGGMAATEQEVRNCVVLMLDRDFFKWMEELRNVPAFKECTPLSERAEDEQFDLELISRYLVLRKIKISALKDITELGAFVTEQLIEKINDSGFDRGAEKKEFERVFTALSSVLGEDSFKRFNKTKNRAEGGILISVFEVLALGLGYHAGLPKFKSLQSKILDVHKKLWDDKSFKENTGSGVRASTRLPVTIKLGRNMLS